MNDDLMSKFRSSDVLLKGLNNPKCIMAMQLLQSNPKEAQTRFANDPEVDVFMKEFGRVMSEHFMKLGEQQEQEQSKKSQQQSQQQQSGNKIQEIGPLHAQVLQQQKSSSVSSNNNNKTGSAALSSSSSSSAVQDKDVDKVSLADKTYCVRTVTDCDQ
jgi:hypothetical protein